MFFEIIGEAIALLLIAIIAFYGIEAAVDASVHGGKDDD